MANKIRKAPKENDIPNLIWNARAFAKPKDMSKNSWNIAPYPWFKKM